MVNYCCVTGCGRSSKLSNHLNFYTLPKEKPRRIQWLKAAKRDDLLKNPNLKGTYRFCSRHFAPACIRNRILTSNAVPTLCLPNEPSTDSQSVSTSHHDILCDSCKKTILGFRYKCVTCEDYDLCPKCEMLETHPGHYMLRIPKPMKFKIADNLIKKWRAFFKAEHVNPDFSDDQSGHSSDDEPISKHVRNYDSGVDLAEDVKDTIRNEVARVLALKPDARKKRKKLMDKSSQTSVKRAKVDRNVLELEVKEPKPSLPEKVPEVAFADVNNYKDQLDVKNEVVASVAGGEENSFDQPLMHVRLSDDLSELMIEMTNNGEKTVFKYN